MTSLETAMPRPAVSKVMDITERSHSLPWGEREIESRDIPWIIEAASPTLKKKRESKKHPTKEAAAKLTVFLINKTQLSPKCCRSGEGCSHFFLGTFLVIEQ